jgi:hypothetical protein
MYPLHLDARANDPRISLRALGSPLLTCHLLYGTVLCCMLRCECHFCLHRNCGNSDYVYVGTLDNRTNAFKDTGSSGLKQPTTIPNKIRSVSWRKPIQRGGGYAAACSDEGEERMKIMQIAIIFYNLGLITQHLCS